MADIDINQLTQKVNSILQEYADDINTGVKVSAGAVAKETVKQLKQTSPKNKNGSVRHYAKTWKSQIKQNRLGSTSVVIYNEKNWRLTHLLEKDHYSRSGKIVKGKPHIEPAEEMAIKAFEKEVEKLI